MFLFHTDVFLSLPLFPKSIKISSGEDFFNLKILKIVLAILQSVAFHINFRIRIDASIKYLAGIV